MFSQDAFIDWGSGECHFDSELFQEVLEYVRQFPDSIGLEEEISPARFQDGDVLFAIADMGGLRQFQLYEELFGENAACIGFPTVSGAGGTLLLYENAFGIAATSGHKDGAWEFIEFFLKQADMGGQRQKK